MPKEIYGVATILGGVAAFYFIGTYSGPYRLIADLMVAHFSTNVLALSFLLTFLLCAAPLLGVVYVIERRIGTRTTWFTPLAHNLDLALTGIPGRIILLGATTLVMGSYFAAKDMRRGPLTQITASALEHGERPKSGYVELTDGTILGDANIRLVDGSITYHYIPVVSGNATPVLFLRASDSEALRFQVPGTDPRSAPIRGVIDENGMPGEIRSQLEDAHAIGPTDYVISLGKPPDVSFAAGIAVVGFVILIIGLIWQGVRLKPLLAGRAA